VFLNVLFAGQSLKVSFVKKTESIVLLNAIKKVLLVEKDRKTKEPKNANIAGKNLLGLLLISAQRVIIFVLTLVLPFGGLNMGCMVKIIRIGWADIAKKNIEMAGQR